MSHIQRSAPTCVRNGGVFRPQSRESQLPVSLCAARRLCALVRNLKRWRCFPGLLQTERSAAPNGSFPFQPLCNCSLTRMSPQNSSLQDLPKNSVVNKITCVNNDLFRWNVAFLPSWFAKSRVGSGLSVHSPQRRCVRLRHSRPRLISLTAPRDWFIRVAFWDQTSHHFLSEFLSLFHLQNVSKNLSLQKQNCHVRKA